MRAMLAGAGCAVRLVTSRMEVAGGPCAGSGRGFQQMLTMPWRSGGRRWWQW